MQVQLQFRITFRIRIHFLLIILTSVICDLIYPRVLLLQSVSSHEVIIDLLKIFNQFQIYSETSFGSALQIVKPKTTFCGETTFCGDI